MVKAGKKIKRRERKRREAEELEWGGRRGRKETERGKNVRRKRKAIERRGYTEAVKPLEAENQSDVDPYSRNVKYSFGGIPIREAGD